MQEFRITNEGSRDIEYVVLKCPLCGRIQRFMHKQEFFGKVPKNAGCKQCEKSMMLEGNTMDSDPLLTEPGEQVYFLKDGKWVMQPPQKSPLKADFTTADKI